MNEDYGLTPAQMRALQNMYRKWPDEQVYIFNTYGDDFTYQAYVMMKEFAEEAHEHQQMLAKLPPIESGICGGCSSLTVIKGDYLCRECRANSES